MSERPAWGHEEQLQQPRAVDLPLPYRYDDCLRPAGDQKDESRSAVTLGALSAQRDVYSSPDELQPELLQGVYYADTPSEYDELLFQSELQPAPEPLADEFPAAYWSSPPASSSSSSSSPGGSQPATTSIYQELHTNRFPQAAPPLSYSSGSPASTVAHRSSEDDHDDDDELYGGDNASSHGKTKQQSLLQRRRRNRESMRRARMKEKEALTSLRSTLTQLETKYQALTKWELQATSPQQVQHCQFLQKQLAQVIQLRRELEAENVFVQQFLDDKQQSIRDLEKVLAECRLDEDNNDYASTAEKLALLEAQEATYSPSATERKTATDTTCADFEYGFVPLSAIEVDALLSKFCLDLQNVKALARETPLHRELFSEVLGWQTHRHVDHENQMHFEFTKCFHHLSTRDMVERAWADGVNLEQYKEAHRKNANIRRMDFLQQVHDRLRIIVREIKHPQDNTIFRTHYALFMLETAEGYLFGIQSINPTEQQEQEQEQEQEQDQSEPAEKVVWVDASICVEFVRRPRVFDNSSAFTSPLDDTEDNACFRQDDCEVRWRGKTNYKTPKHAAENALSFLMGILKWENLIAGPRFHLTAS